MKVVFGATELVFNETTSKIVDETLKIIENYQSDIRDLNVWLNNEQKRLKSEYEKRHAFIVSSTEDALHIHAMGITE